MRLELEAGERVGKLAHQRGVFGEQLGLDPIEQRVGARRGERGD